MPQLYSSFFIQQLQTVFSFLPHLLQKFALSEHSVPHLSHFISLTSFMPICLFFVALRNFIRKKIYTEISRFNAEQITYFLCFVHVHGSRIIKLLACCSLRNTYTFSYIGLCYVLFPHQAFQFVCIYHFFTSPSCCVMQLMFL